ncbi:nucleopolyhedrovirus P10 family protein [Streptomyces sp. NPDC101166]|uniref:nucleopolyhedrovirus P10 family protein n=1 Tax=Streptomyces sp. NPDC101166 TaxID=3366120 RepID=UPI003805384B
MTAERWTRAVREQLGLGRLLPLGGPRDGVWIAEAAAETALRRAVRMVGGVRLGALRIALADPSGAYEPAVPPPPSGLPPGPLRVTADCAATASEPLPAAASRLREALAAAAQGVGLAVTEVDLRVTALLEGEPEGADEAGGGLGERERGPEPPSATAPDRPAREGDELRVGVAALAVPGVTGLTSALGRSVRIEERQLTDLALPRRHVRVELAVSADHRALDVARRVREAVTTALPDHPTVTVLVTALR